MITPARVDLRVGRNDHLVTTFTFADGDTAVDLSAMTLQMQVRLWQEAGGAALVDLAEVGSATVQGLYVLDAAAGQFQVFVTEDTVSGLPANGDPTVSQTFAYDIRLTDADGVKQTYVYGDFVVVPGVTRDA